MKTKYCKTCNTTKPRGDFNKNARRKDKLQFRCRACEAAYYAANKNKVRAKHAVYNVVNKDKVRAKQAVYKVANKVKITATSAAWHAANRERNKGVDPYADPTKLKYCPDCSTTKFVTAFNRNISNKGGLNSACKDCANARSSTRAHEHPAKVNANGAKRRALKRNATIGDLDEIKQLQEQRWFIESFMGCAADADHVIPLSKGGAHDIANLQWLPATLNASKGTKTHKEALLALPEYRAWFEPTFEQVTYVSFPRARPHALVA
ncbi:MAG: hypothetical protein WD051_14040 [Steroidobacteraceae bacterium]